MSLPANPLLPTVPVRCLPCYGTGTITAYLGGTPEDDTCPGCWGAGRVHLTPVQLARRQLRLAEEAQRLRPSPEGEQRVIDAEKALYEALRPDYDAACDARVAAGLSPF